ncbi:MAG: TRAM domain-containing protein, partial [Candidatus Eisenbacteria bacterium]
MLSVGVEDIALGGKGLARVDGKVVFVDRGLPGDQVTVRITKTNKRFAEARLTAIEHPSAQRVPARCAHVDRCGGCRLQELPYEAQAALKERQVREALRHLGGIAEPPVRPIVHAPSAWHYRNKMEYSFMPAYEPVAPTSQRSGTPPQASGAPGPDAPGKAGPAAPQAAMSPPASKEVAVLGMHERGTFDRVFELHECWLPSPLTVEIVRYTQAFARTHGWRAYHPSRHDGVARFLT